MAVRVIQRLRRGRDPRRVRTLRLGAAASGRRSGSARAGSPRGRYRVVVVATSAAGVKLRAPGPLRSAFAEPTRPPARPRPSRSGGFAARRFRAREGAPRLDREAGGPERQHDRFSRARASASRTRGSAVARPQPSSHAAGGLRGGRPPELREDGAASIDAMRRRGHTRQLVVHTGQHYDRRLSDDILADLGFPEPDVSPRSRLRHARATRPARSLVGLRAGAAGAPARPGGRGRRRELHARLRARRRQARRAGGPPGGRPALRRLDHARGDQPRADRPHVRRAPDPQPRGRAEPAARGHRPGAHPLRGQHDDRLAPASSRAGRAAAPPGASSG